MDLVELMDFAELMEKRPNSQRRLNSWKKRVPAPPSQLPFIN